MLGIHGLTLEREGRTLFRDLGLSLFPGACVVIRGRNGSGKTSLLRLIAGLEQPTSGLVAWEDVPIAEHPDYPNQCQFVGHRNAMKPYLTVEENLLFWAKLHDAEMLMPIATELWELGDVLDEPYQLLSQGWQRRVALARLLVSPGKVWLMDEPMANLDKEGVDLLERLLQSRCGQGGIVLMTSHIEVDLPFADQLFVQDFLPLAL